MHLSIQESSLFFSSLPPCDQPTYYENCPSDTLPSNSVFDPSVGIVQLSCGTSAQTEGECVTLGDDNIAESYRCPANYVLVGSDNNRPVCCQLKGICLTDCFKPKILYSFKLGFEFEIKEGYALVGKSSYGSCSEDPTVFQIEVCELTQQETSQHP
ncbi:hypothetical protein KP79_PYT18348 [Mizuhopecten yessoensis]|uniref:Uncharacterized protein n=1 Tax=Mizuhopecten yessoensis TaxID=6573 RepID=A0A210QPN7_MIZYE|nr:hypothetical protein KP79_PYT18348 [Mizuhopecten yessoensis]